MTENPFIRGVRDGVVFYSCIELERLPWLRHGFSTRHGGTGTAGNGWFNLSKVSWDTPENVAMNRRLLLDALDMADSPLVTLSQIHSDRVHIIRENPEQGNQRLEGDALATERQGIAIGVLVADCFPVLIADVHTRAIGCVHSGWKGTLNRILFKTIASMRAAFASDPKNLRIAVGPGIGSCCYEVGVEVADAFASEYPGVNVCQLHPEKPGKYLLDLNRALEEQIREAGVSPSSVHALGSCTRCNVHEFHSFRGDGSRSGRMMATIARMA